MSHIVVVWKPDSQIFALFLDPKPLNKALRWSHYQLPMLEEVFRQLSNAKVFTVADVRNSFWQVELD